MAFNTLEEIKVRCDRLYQAHGHVHVNDSQIAQTQVPPSRTYCFRVTVLPPSNGTAEAVLLDPIRIEAIASGFAATINSGRIREGGNHLELIVPDKRAPMFANGQPVLFRANGSGPATRFRILRSTWNQTSQEYEYHIQSEVDPNQHFRTVGEHDLSPTP